MLPDDTIEAMLMRHEGVKKFPYRCSANKLTIGIGRNIQDVGLSTDEMMYLLHNDITRVIKELTMSIPFFADLDEVRRWALIDMCFNMGISRLMRFKRMLRNLDICDFGKAADEAQDSAWFKQVGTRAVEVVAMIRHG